jgi:hypothetical protein
VTHQFNLLVIHLVNLLVLRVPNYPQNLPATRQQIEESCVASRALITLGFFALFLVIIVVVFIALSRGDGEDAWWCNALVVL